MAYKTAGYQFSPRLSTGGAGALADMPRVQDIAVPESSGLRFEALPAPVVLQDQSASVAQSIAGGITDLGKGILAGYMTKREDDMALAKEERDWNRKMELELLKQERYEEAERKRDERLNKTIQARLDLVGATKAAEEEAEREEEIDFLDDEENLSDTVVEENLPGEETIYDKNGKARIEPLLPVEGEDIPMEGGPVRASYNAPVVPDEQLETEDLPALNPPLSQVAPYGFQDIGALPGAQPGMAEADLSAIPPEYLMAQAQGVPPAAPVDELPLKDLGLSLENIDVSFVTPQMERELRETRGGYRQQLAGALLEQAARAQGGQPLAEMEPVGEKPKGLPKGFKPGPYRSAERAYEMSNMPMPEGFAPPKVDTLKDKKGGVYFMVNMPERLTPKEEKTAEGGGGKTVTAADTKQLGDFDSVIYTLNVIENKLKKIEQRGPIVGQVRGRNPYDPDAQEIENLVTSVVPGLARGVFGEVGVLTDTDVARYMKLVPNIKTNPESARRAFINLRDKVAASKLARLETLRDFGYDVSGKINEMEKLKTRMDTTTGVINEQVRSLATQLMSMKKGTPEYEASWKQLLELRKRQRAAEEKESQ
jgi:hypothetical protein